MKFFVPKIDHPFVVRGTEIRPDDTPEQYLQKLARVTLDEMFQLVGVLTADGILLECNRAALDAGGLTRDDVIGKPFWETYWWTCSPKTQQDLRGAIARAAQGEFIRYDTEVYGRKGGAETMIMDFTLIPVKDAQGRIVFLLPEGRDITEKKAYEREIARQREELAQLDRRKDEFLATLSHELRNSLAPLLNSLHLMRLKGDRPNPVSRDIMERQVNHLVRLVDDLLEVSRITRGLLELRRERVDVATIVRNAVETSHSLVQAGGHRLDVSLPGEALWLEGDPVRLTQVLGNLLNNAAKYTDDGGTIALSARSDGDSVVISVRDNGWGITADSLESIFEMFRREAHAKRRNQSGLGIGLTLSRQLAEMHGGTIEARSDGEGRGSEFIVRLPLAGASALAAGPVLAAQGLPGAIRILVVDDHEDGASSLGMLLEALGAEVDVVHDGPAALEMFAATNPSVILLDVTMPQMDGYEVARALRARFPGRRPTIIALTGRGQAEDHHKAREAGIDHHIVKPADFERLRDLLSNAAR